MIEKNNFPYCQIYGALKRKTFFLFFDIALNFWWHYSCNDVLISMHNQSRIDIILVLPPETNAGLNLESSPIVNYA